LACELQIPCSSQPLIKTAIWVAHVVPIISGNDSQSENFRAIDV
jgi:hypothetical protein